MAPPFAPPTPNSPARTGPTDTEKMLQEGKGYTFPSPLTRSLTLASAFPLIHAQLIQIEPLSFLCGWLKTQEATLASVPATPP